MENGLGVTSKCERRLPGVSTEPACFFVGVSVMYFEKLQFQ